MHSAEHPAEPDGCTCTFYGHGLTRTRVVGPSSALCPVHGDAAHRAELVTRWRETAAQLDGRARVARADGDPLGAEELEQVATDYRVAAEGIEGC